MAINIQNLISVISTKAAALDSTATDTETINLTNLINNLNATSGVLEYRSFGQLPTPDSATIGHIVYVQDKIVDQYGSFYFGTADSWQKITLTADSDEAALSLAPSYTFQGGTSGYISGNIAGDQGRIEKFSLTSDGNASDIGTLSVSRYDTAGASSNEASYITGGVTNTPSVENVIDKMPFAAEGTATDVGNLAVATYWGSGQSSENYGYMTGGPAGSAPTCYIQKYSFVSDGDATNIGNTTQVMFRTAGCSSETYGYSAGSISATPYGTIEKFPFTTDENTTDVADLPTAHYHSTGQSSTLSGYVSGGNGTLNVIEKFSFSSDANGTDVGDLTVGRDNNPAGVSSDTYGYTCGGSPARNQIDKFSFASDGNATDVGDMTQIGWQLAGTQY